MFSDCETEHFNETSSALRPCEHRSADGREPIAALSKVAQARGWQIVETFNDAGISGAKERKDRPGLDEMLKQAQRGRFEVVMAWAIDRLGRSLVDLLHTIESLKACGVDLYLDQQAIDTTTPAGKLMLQMCGAFAEFERSMLQARIQAGLKRAVANGRTLGRPLNDPQAIDRARLGLGEGHRVAKLVGLSNGTVQRDQGGNGGIVSGPGYLFDLSTVDPRELFIQL
jgi:DNA invertase Pin-like site-specific DNA recombinase